MTRKKMWTTAALLGAILAACGGEEPREAEPPAAAGGMHDMPMQGMEDMPMEGMGGEMMAEMQAHMQGMEGASADRLAANLPRHRQMVGNMIAQMNREMREMNMAADEEWNATLAAIRDDLVRLPEMTPAELEAFMPEHRERVARLMEMHRGMMAEMGM